MTDVVVAVDVGASSGRVVAGRVVDRTGRDGGLDIELQEVHRFPNGVTERDGHLRWDIGRIIDEVRHGLALVPDAASIGISTWAVDYGLLDDDGTLLADPIAYRDDRTAAAVDDVHATVSPADLFAVNGLQHLPFNTVFQLVAEQRSPHWARAAHAVLVPDLVAHALTGALRTEVTNASTTGLLDARTHAWSTDLLDRLAIPPDLLPPLDAPGDHRGTTAAGVPVTTVGSHDTASAVVGVPATTERFAYVVSGTWSLVGLELPQPVLTDAARDARFTNELGVDGRTRYLRNVGGLWLLQECMRTWGATDVDALLAAAATVASGGPLVDVDDDAFIPPDAMPGRIARAAGRDLDRAATVRCILDSLAAAYARTIVDAESTSGRSVDVVHVVGGGSRNALLCQLTADACGRPVIAGPVEATARGNIVVQARSRGLLPASIDEIRAATAPSLALQRYEPR